MWEWMRQFFSTETPSKQLDEAQKHNRQLQKLLADSLKDSQVQNRKLIDALDRVLISKFDPPLMAKPMEQARNLAFPDVSDVLSIEDDASFIDAMEKMNA
jgi:hypothetical protein